MTETLNDFPYLIALLSDSYKRAVEFALRHPTKGAMKTTYTLSTQIRALEADFNNACLERYGAITKLDANAIYWVQVQEDKLISDLSISNWDDL
jgi:hypothetical protein